MGSGFIEITERRGKGTRGSSYVYVAEEGDRGGTLVHIGAYASTRRESEFEGVTYSVPASSLRDKTLLRFSFSGSGLPFVKIGRVKAMEPLEIEWRRLAPRELVERFRGYRYEVYDEELERMIGEFEEGMIPMIEDLKKYEARLGFRISFMDRSRRLEEAYKDPEFYYFMSMSIPDDRGRKRSLRVTRRWIYQLWVLKEICEALEIREFKARDEEGAIWWIEQGSEIATFTAETSLGDMTFWLEFQPGKMAHMVGISTRERLPVRPDIVGVRGSYRYVRELLDAGKGIDLMVECKEDPFAKWKGDLEGQIAPYLDFFKPRSFLLVSMKPIPTDGINFMEDLGIKVVDGLDFKNEERRELLRRYVREIVSRWV